MSSKITKYPLVEIRQVATEACLSSGASVALTNSLVEATLSAACLGRPDMGFPHFLDYLHSLREGRIDGHAEPRINYVLPAFIHSDARGGIAQLGFDLIFQDLVKRARTFGIAIFTQKNSYTAGELGYYVRRLAMEGLISMATANGPAVLAPSAGVRPTFCTNPLAFGSPLLPPSPPLVIDQASSATAFVNIVRAATEGSAIPEGWAVDDSGLPTTDPKQAMLGALLPFGGYKGANIALLVEVLSAGLSGAAWSLDAGDFRSGSRHPNAGLTIIAISPRATDPSFECRSSAYVNRLKELGLHVPGSGSANSNLSAVTEIEIDAGVLKAIREFILPSDG